ncbi:TetR/AcrR family transcriptional regulator [Mycobacterium sp. MS1601]|uniref:TetR/AcrR family transcriptional regulator n=1 Tax=Mycobacterium sp. MS1601 TaxID=1936029 RepID=UPI0009F8CC87|nr:TetR/AcrR family transcriptional regulator [Mycobacterium sp. MS1601]
MQRRRGAELEAAIRAAVLELVAARGAAGVTMEAVAAAAGTSKPVLYRRWPDSQALVRDTLLTMATTAIPAADTGSYRTDMLATLRGWVALFTGPTAPLLRAVIAAMSHDDVLADAFRSEVIGWRKEQMGELLARGVARGEVRADVDVDILRELAQSVLWHRLLITDDPIDDDLAVRLVDNILLPLVTPTTAGS